MTVNRPIISFIFLVALALFPMTAQGKEVLYAKKQGVKVKKTVSPISKTLYTLNKGTSVTVLKHNGRYIQVRLKGNQNGWVFKYHLTKLIPANKNTTGGLSSLFGERNKVSLKESRSGGSIRGLQPVTQTYVRNKKIQPANLEAVQRMERYHLSQADLLQFQKEGSLGEFSGDVQ